MKKKALLRAGLCAALTACRPAPAPPAAVAEPAPPAPAPEESPAYWLSHPGIALVAADHNMGPDTVMAIVAAFNALYPVKGRSGPREDGDHTVAIRPVYTGQGPDAQLLRRFFLDQARYYRTTRHEIAAVVSEAYRNGNRLTQRD